MGCSGEEETVFKEAIELGGQSIAPVILNRGRKNYNHYCRACHGILGDGMGPLGLHQKPPARDFRLGIIKFASVPAGSLPTDGDLARVIHRGIPGTAMLPWRVPQEELFSVVQYLKTFSPRWRKEKAGQAIAMSPDPWKTAAEGALHGAKIYHEKARCSSCHPSYLPNMEGTALENNKKPRLIDSVYGPIKATNFLKDRLRNGETTEDLYRVIAAGVGGTGMPAWKGVLPERDLWALVHFIVAMRRDHAVKP